MCQLHVALFDHRVLKRRIYSFVPEEQLNDKILEYGEYIKVVIMTLVALAVVYFMVKYLYKRFYKKG